ncbi:MAG TPA: hypothetical protein VM513_07160 [Kofleriaceae bacterium]|nr:hypothetical protein [Kofleriaceae bacterium]
MIDGVPGESSLEPQARDAWCERLVPLAEAHLARPGDRIEKRGACAVELYPAATEQRVPDVHVRFDAAAFFRKPYAAASYDASTRTLFLPLDALEAAWNEVPATVHEWGHAAIHARARTGDPIAAALATRISGPAYRPDPFHVDELPINLCDVLRARERGGEPQPWQLPMVRTFLAALESELAAMKELRGTRETLDGMEGTRLETTNGISRWVGGRDLANSLAVLERVRVDTGKAIELLEAPVLDANRVRALHPFDHGVCL